METLEILNLLAQGEDSQNQFKKNVNNIASLAAEMIAFSNGQGGRIYIGVNDDGSVEGLTGEDIQRLNQMTGKSYYSHINYRVCIKSYSY